MINPIFERRDQAGKFNVIFFDLGNVLVHVFPERAIRRLAALLKTTEQTVHAMWQDNKSHFSEYEKGLITSFQLFERIFKDNRLIKVEDFYSAFTAMFELNQDVAELAASLSKNYRLSIISNTNQLHFDKIMSEYGDVMALFSKPVTSFEAHVQKPDGEIFRCALKKLACAADDAILIDDKNENVDAARGIGIHGIQYSSSEKLKQQLIELGVM